MPHLLDHPLISERYFFPRRAPFPEGLSVPTEGGTLACWRSAPPSDRPLLLHFHGNGEIVQDYLPDFAHIVDALGMDLFLAEYRGYGASEGIPALHGMLADVPRILEATGLSAERILLFGRSVGSGPTVYLASRPSQRPTGTTLDQSIIGLSTAAVGIRRNRKLKF